MSETIILAAMAGAIAMYLLMRRSQEPNLLNEILNGLRAQAQIERARGGRRADEFQQMADAIMSAQIAVKCGRSLPPKEYDFAYSRILCASAGDVLDALSIFEQNHRHQCYQAILRLAGKLMDLDKRTSSAVS